jgi:hypothetical protein
MSFRESTFAVTNPGSIPSFTGPVTLARIGRPPVMIDGLCNDSPIDLLSSGEEDGYDSMPELVNRLHRHDDSSSDEDGEVPELLNRHDDSSSDEEYSDDEDKNVTRRTTPNRFPHSIPPPSYFESDDDDEDVDHEDTSDDDDDDDDEEYMDDSSGTYPAFGTNRVLSYSQHKKRSKKQLLPTSTPTNASSSYAKRKKYSKKQSKPASVPSANTDAVTDQSYPPEQHRASSRIWTSPLCPKGICLIAETDINVHIIQDCPVGQVYVFRELTSITHFQLVDCKLASYLKAGFAADFPVLLYRMNRNHVSPFCVVLNNAKTISPIIDSIRFEKLNHLLVEVDPQDVFGSLRQAKRSSISYGFATSRCVHRNENGTAVPNFLKNTLEPFIKNLFVTMSSIFKMDLLPSWAKYKPVADRLPFAASIAEDNVLEGLTIHLTNHNNLLQPHKDAHNPPYSDNSQLSIVVGASRWVDGNRIGATGYFRKSVSASKVRSDVTAPLLAELANVYSDLPPHRRHLNPEMFEAAHKDGCHLDENHFTTPCNIDPMGELYFNNILSILSAPYKFYFCFTKIQ